MLMQNFKINNEQRVNFGYWLTSSNTHLNVPSRAVVYVACLSSPADSPCSMIIKVRQYSMHNKWSSTSSVVLHKHPWSPKGIKIITIIYSLTQVIVGLNFRRKRKTTPIKLQGIINFKFAHFHSREWNDLFFPP